jgi:hypothetical protein
LSSFAIKADRAGREGMANEAEAEKKSEVGFYVRPFRLDFEHRSEVGL